MSDYRDPTLRSLNDCGCCEGQEVTVPIRVSNRPGLANIAYRVGTQSQFKESLLTRLSTLPYPVLKQLTTRGNDDFAIALLDAWATVADVLTFYQERIANESYLRTATERLSLVHLSQLLGYKPRPGVAASTHLAFTLEDNPQSPRQVLIEAGTKVQSIPGPSEDAQIFETVEAIEARPEWNVLKPRTTQPPRFSNNTEEIYVQGTNTQLKPGDALLLVESVRERSSSAGQWDFKRVRHVTPNPSTNQTRLELDGSTTQIAIPVASLQVYALRQRAALFGHNASDPRLLPSAVTGNFPSDLPTDWSTEPSTRQQDWNFTLSGSVVNLDTVYPNIVPKSWAVLVSSDNKKLYRITAVSEASPRQYTLSNKATQLTFQDEDLSQFGGGNLRSTVVFAQSEELAIAEPPYTLID